MSKLDIEFVKVVGVKFRVAGRIYNYLTNDLELIVGDYVVVNTPKGLGLGKVVIAPTLIPKDKASTYSLLCRKTDPDGILANLSPATLDGSIDSEPKIPEQLEFVMKKAEDADFDAYDDNLRKGRDAYRFCLTKINEKNMPMKLIDVEYTLNGKKAIFFFTSEGRVDFRELVKELLKTLKVRIELRQIGIRDEAKMLGAVACCGRELCCSTFLRSFTPVSIKMAKDQNLALNPTKVSGVCGRLMCCLSYEEEVYEQLKKELPRIGQKVRVAEGDGKIFKINVFSKRVDVLLEDGSFAYSDCDSLQIIGDVNAKDLPMAHNLTNQMEQGSEEELKAIDDSKERSINIKDTFMKTAGGGDNRDNRRDDRNRNR
jgi:cell fate regulator YaaT (PSP1 superfamily)